MCEELPVAYDRPQYRFLHAQLKPLYTRNLLKGKNYSFNIAITYNLLHTPYKALEMCSRFFIRSYSVTSYNPRAIAVSCSPRYLGFSTVSASRQRSTTLQKASPHADAICCKHGPVSATLGGKADFPRSHDYISRSAHGLAFDRYLRPTMSSTRFQSAISMITTPRL